MDEKIIKLNQIMILMISPILVLNIASLVNNVEYKNFGMKSIDAAYLLFSLFFIIMYKWKALDFTKFKAIYSLFALYTFIYLYSYIQYQDDRSLETMLHFTLYFVIILSLLRMKWNKQGLIILASGLSIFILVVFRHWVYQDFRTGNFRSYITNPNGLGIILYCSIFFTSLAALYSKAIGKVIFATISAIGFILIIATSSRSVYLTLLAFVIFYFILKFRIEWFKKLFLPILLVNLTFPIIYILISKGPIAQIVSNLFVNIFTQTIFSGREIIWEPVIENGILKSPFLGNGYGTMPWDISEVNLTTHNVYLQVLLEVGMFGLFVFCMILFYIWRLLKDNLHTIAGQFSACYLLALLLYINFELTLFPNSPSFATIGIFQWLGVTIGINFVESRESINTQTNSSQNNNQRKVFRSTRTSKSK
ncbi:O-antigen ligase family protein [Terrihalobacillus insolitus]|uniref:O-antigen ligase family protein n=1 Tax=Terrihalobacillus insolitus TaxID=2950438 RepID=UPI002341A3CD|nr:O-antigen ligase family protein [Terrihalobacillus insolitus]MDC3411829.1 O-antigen ligase family protein [Terrihalobacillus insolitus]